MRTEYGIEVNCPPEHLWPYLEEPEKQKLWMKGLLENETTSTQQTGVGTTFKMKIKEGGKTAEYFGEVLKYERHKLLGIKLWGGSFKDMEIFVDYTLFDLHGRTKLDYLATMEIKGLLMKIFSPLFKVFGMMQLKSFFRTLKQLAEASPSRAQS